MKNQLSTIGDLVNDKELVMNTLNSLPLSWEAFIQSLVGHPKLPKFDRIWAVCIQEETRLATRSRIHGTYTKKVRPLHLMSRKERVREGGFITRKERVREGSFMERNERVEDKVLLQFKRRRRVFHASISTHALNLRTMPNIVVIQRRGSMKPQL